MLEIQKKIAMLGSKIIDDSIKDLTKHDLIRKIDQELLKDKGWKQRALEHWLHEPQLSCRCPDCQIDIRGPRALMHKHLMKHSEKRSKEVNDSNTFESQFRIHYPLANKNYLNGF